MSLIDRFRTIAAAYTAKTAVMGEGWAMRYGELSERAGSIAAALVRAGVGKGSIVALAADRGAEMIPALLGISSIGAVYLPLDAASPDARLRFIHEDAKPSLVLCADAERWARIGARTLRFEDIARAEAPAQLAIGRDDACYVMYTSGSTGKPKGVIVPHRGVLRLVCDVSYVKLGPDETILQAAPLGFDASTFEIWGALLNGGTVLMHPEALPSARGLQRSIARGVSTAWLTSGLFNALIDEDPSVLAPLKQLLTGGETLSVAHVRRALRALPETALYNGYGPTECTTFATMHRIARDGHEDPIPIGRAIDRTSTYVIDGELCIGGDGVALGYLNRPELSAERFVAAPDGGLMYRTGDRVSQGEDGVLRFIGRDDQQVKIRGFRIELSEIEAALAALPGVSAAAVKVEVLPSAEKRLVAYTVGAPVDARARLSSELPEYMVPAITLQLAQLPLTTNGKLDRKALPEPQTLSASFASLMAEVLALPSVEERASFFDLGGSSLLALRLVSRIEARLGLVLDVVRVFEHASPAALAASLASRGELARAAVSRRDEAIAIVGMSGRFPGADELDAFWQMLCEGKEGITFFDEVHPLEREASRDPAYVRARGVLLDVKRFDAAFFGITPLEASVMDPQQRVLLEEAWKTLEHAGYVPETASGRVGVFAGSYNNSYYARFVAQRPDLIARLGAFSVMLANEKDYVALRIAHRLGLTGPALSVHTACSTSLVAVAIAMQSLQSGQCDLALAGGAAITCPVESGYVYAEGGMLSRDGHTRTFDEQATGTTFSDGVGFVALKRLCDAQRDGDTIYALLTGAGLNNDGSNKASFTAPSVAGQARAIADAHAAAGISAGDVAYVEAHGTATPLGDPIEIEALTRAFGDVAPGSCAIGSVKSNIGHLTAAAGVAGLIKTALALHHQRLPASLHFAQPSTRIPFARTPFVPLAQARAWPRAEKKRIAGVSSFGVGGTNAHVVVEEAPLPPHPVASVSPSLFILSARSKTALDRVKRALSAAVAKQGDLSAVASTLVRGRRAFSYRASFVAATPEEASRAALEAEAQLVSAKPPLVFLFPGQGAQHLGMGKSLYERDPAFAEHIDAAARIAAPLIDADLREVMFGADASRLQQTRFTQPALFAVSYATARAWQRLGVEPDTMIGHSVGEFVCAVLAGVMRFEDAVALVCKRGVLMQSMPPGAMLSVRGSAAETEAWLSGTLAIASENSRVACVVAGPEEEIAALEAKLASTKVASKRLQTSHAFHHPMMEPAARAFAADVQAVALNAPSRPFLSTRTGKAITAEEATSTAYWAEHLRAPVRFSAAVEALFANGDHLLLEVGPRSTLATLAKQHVGARSALGAVPSLGDAPERELERFLATAGKLWRSGVPVALEALVPRARRIGLPTYPFEGDVHWAEPTPLSLPEPAQELPEMPSPTAMQNDLRAIIEEVSGVEISEAETNATFLELGLDSLFLSQIAMAIQRKLGVKLAFRQLMEQYATLQALAAHLSGSAAPASTSAVPLATLEASPPPRPKADEPAGEKKPFGAIARITLKAQPLTPKQKARLDALIERYTKKTKASRAHTEEHRGHHADPRVVTGFKPAMKELVYPLVVKRSAGPYVWDLDDNQYIDCLNGFGCNYFGWQPEFINRAVIDRLERGHEIGPQSPLAGEVAKLVTEMTGFDRAAFCNTGSEAVMGCTRIARTVTGRSLIALFSGSYHGIFDEVIVRGTKKLRAIPAAPGIMPSTAENVLVLDYGTEESLRILKERAGELAAILVEPVQSRRPDFQPRDYLHALRALSEASGTALIFDEVITGFRTAPGGAQEHFGVRADLASYGKVVGGGLPIGVICGKREWMDALDGGAWQFGDDSAPQASVTYFAGTFVRHPMALAAAKAVIERLRQEGPQLQREMNARTKALAEQLNAVFRAAGAPLEVRSFSTLWKVFFTEEQPYGEVLFYTLRDKGLHIYDGFPCFMTTAHTEADVAAIVSAFKSAVSEMQEATFLPPPIARAVDWTTPPLPGARLGRDPQGNPAWYAPDPAQPGKFKKV